MESVTENNDLTIRAHGFGFNIMCFMFLLFIIPSIILIILFFIPNNEMYFNWFGLLICIITLLIWGYELVNWIIERKVKFVNNKFIFFKFEKNKSKNKLIKLDCKDIIDYNYKFKNLLSYLEFDLISGKKVKFHYIIFSKKQFLKILNEIKIRGGLNNIEIKLKKQ